MSDLSAAERIAADALKAAGLTEYGTGLDPDVVAEVGSVVRTVVAALSAAGWLVEAVQREAVPPLLAVDAATGRVEPVDESQCWPHVQCLNCEPHEPHVHVNGAGHGCGLPEWCPGVSPAGPGTAPPAPSPP